MFMAHVDVVLLRLGGMSAQRLYHLDFMVASPPRYKCLDPPVIRGKLA